MVPAGLVMAAAFVLAISMSFSLDGQMSVLALTQSTQARTGEYGLGSLMLDMLIWAFPIATLVWFFKAWSTVKEAEQSRVESRMRREELESLIKKNARPSKMISRHESIKFEFDYRNSTLPLVKL
jgi:hypothetical protein